MKVSKLIQTGIDNINRYGHIKKAYGSKHIGFCMVGSYTSNFAKIHDDEEIVDALLRNVCNTDILVDWNDDPKRTKKEVITAMEEAKELALSLEMSNENL